MTREEAIQWIQLDIDMAKFDPTTGEDAYLNDDAKNVIEAQELAISALKAQLDLQPTCNELATDTISRQAAIDGLDGHCIERRTLNDWQAGWNAALDWVGGTYLDELPSAQPEPTTEIQDILDYLDTALHPIISPEHWNVYSELHDMISTLPSAQPEPCEDAVSRKLMYELGATCMARRDENGELVALGRLDMLPSAHPENIIQQFRDYQVEWLTSHCDLELEPTLEEWIVRFLNDTAECFEQEGRMNG